MPRWATLNGPSRGALQAALYHSRKARLARIAAANGGGEEEPPAEITSTQWRILVDAYGSYGSYTEIKEVEMRATSGGADQCTGGTADASSEIGASWAASRAFDDEAAPQAWTSANNTPPTWLRYTFPSPVSVTEIVIKSNQATATPTALSFQYWDGDEWITAWSVSGLSWGTGETKTFTKPEE